MPTGYTAKVVEGEVTELQDYMIGCSRAFGALIHMRDESTDAEITKAVPSDFYLEQLVKSKDQLTEIKSMSYDEILKKLNQGYKDTIKSNKKYYEQGELENKRYDDMIDKVKMWNPPSGEHVGLKEFALNQLEISKSTFHKRYGDMIPEYLTVWEWRDSMIKMLEKDIIRYEGQYQEELDRCEDRNKWVEDLIESLV